MPPKSKIKYAPVAVDDMDEIFSYISLDDASAAENLLHKLDHQISGLAEFLNRGSVLPEDEYLLVQRGYRFIVVNPYLIFYRAIPLLCNVCIVAKLDNSATHLTHKAMSGGAVFFYAVYGFLT